MNARHCDDPLDALTGMEIAIVGMAGRFPGADGIDAFWRNIRDGVESVRRFSDEQLRQRGVSEAALADQAYVKAGVVFDGMDQFDAGFFGYTPRDAEMLDPQQRVFLETAWQALEHAGYGDPAQAGVVSVHAGSGANLYLTRQLMPALALNGSQDIAAFLGALNGNDKDSLATRVAYKLDLRGPALSVQTACSTSLVAVHLACRGLLNHEADLALAGGVWLNLHQGEGYRHQQGAILSPDGHCRAFDEQAAGTAIGSGAGVVVLKRLTDALADGDTIHAVIKGSALNNDGADKVGYTAPSVNGQAEVILAAQSIAEVPADSIGYVEAHGTGTTLGDPIEIAALSQAFRHSTPRLGYCALGSVKTNIGHLDAAAGVAGLIKTTLALAHHTLPPSLNFRRANPNIDFAASPFYVNTSARPWPAGAAPRRAGVSSFGMGGTNVHLVLEEAPEHMATPAAERTQLLLVSARSAAARDAAAARLADALAGQPGLALPDVAHTLRLGRKRFAQRTVVLADDHAGAIDALCHTRTGQAYAGEALSAAPGLALLFPGQGAQHAGMGEALYRDEPVFRDAIDYCCERLQPQLGLDLRTLFHPQPGDEDAAAAQLGQTALTQPALFVQQYALAQLWLSWGAQPDALLGHSIGEYVAACIAGVFTLDDALALVAARGRLLQACPPGAMLAVGLPEQSLRTALPAGCDLAAINAPDLCVLAGPADAIDAAERTYAANGVALRRLRVSHAFHSALVAPMLAEFGALLAGIAMQPPRIPIASNVTGRWITPEQACDPAYWLEHLRGTVRFADGLATLLARPDRVLLEVGPGETLTSLARRHPALAGRPAIASQCHPDRRAQNARQPLRALAQLWVAGIELDVLARHTAGMRRVPLPSYPFERASYWITPAAGVAAAPARETGPAGWLYAPLWRRAVPQPDALPTGDGPVLLLADALGIATQLAARWRAAGRRVIVAEPGSRFDRVGADHFQVRVAERNDFAALLSEVGAITDIVHLWSLDGTQRRSTAELLARGFHSLLALAQALDSAGLAGQPLRLTVLADGVEDVDGSERLCAEKATLPAACKVLAQEYPHLACRLVDVIAAAMPDAAWLEAVCTEMAVADGPSPLALRGRHRWFKDYEAVTAPAASSRLREGGVYLITGGLGGVGLALARHLARRHRAQLVLLGRSALPPREQWPALIAKGEPAQAARLQAVLDLEAAGAEVLVLAADVADASAWPVVLAAVRQRFDALHGVIHAAGIAGGGIAAQRSRADAEAVLAPKLAARGLLDALGDAPLDFVLLCSSLSVLTGGFGQLDYCAANGFLDALAAETTTPQRPVLTVNWDVWRGLGMAAAQQLPDGIGIGAHDAGPLLEQLLAMPAASQLAVSTAPLQPLLAGQPSLALAERLGGETPPRRAGHPRPMLTTPFLAPEEGLEADLAVLWSEFLGITGIGADDSLFELGGDSLLAIQLLARVRQAYGVELHPGTLFRAPTIAALARQIETHLIEELENVQPAEPAPLAV
ncbi:type I polyketide synthase [Chitinolyticbacter meiyuanensis]|uniref:type I polyketide synthase n=1 Tax=Chitinolyticbacter meiyuanensis TaxID=682798 RepID=UPI0011E5A0D3|nr:type I polyketide synthase [Chitinolyticbacter meiyuanensis]